MALIRLFVKTKGEEHNQKDQHHHGNLLKSEFMSCCLLILSVLVLGQQPRVEWKAPASADAVKNPMKGVAAAVVEGKKLYTQYCVVCHGVKGKGDGPAAMALNPKPADHSSEKIQSQTDGAIFWKMTTGRTPMASYATTLTEVQRWQLVCYIRTLKKA